MKPYSTTNTYTDKHSGKSYTSSQIENKLKKAKKRLFEIQTANIGYNRCEKCGIKLKIN
jgi:hypothetical protein